MRANTIFALTLWFALVLAYLFSGEQFLDLAFAMPDLGAVDDFLLGIVFTFEEAKEALRTPDLFSQFRTFLHDLTGLG